MKADPDLRLIRNDTRRLTEVEEWGNKPWWVRWFVVGVSLTLWAAVINFLIFGWLYL